MKEKQEKKWFKKYFINYFWLGICLILLSSLLQEPSEKSYFIKIISLLCETLGAASFVAALFNFTVETTDFVNKIRDILENIVIKKDFLNNINEDSKRQVLANILKPSDEQIKKYSNIENYYTYYVNETLNVTSKNVRSNYNINLHAKIDKVENKIMTEGTYSYRLYPSNNGFTPISIGFLKNDTLSSCDVIVNMPNGKRSKFDYKKDIEPHFTEREDSKVTKIDIEKLGEDFEHLDIELRIKEYGYDHWMNVFFKAEQATDGFNFNLTLEEPLQIQMFNVFDVGHNYHIDESESKNNIHIGCHQWINEGAGLSVIVSTTK